MRPLSNAMTPLCGNARRRRPRGPARLGRGRQLRGPPVRRALGAAVRHGDAQMPRTRLCAAPLRRLPDGLPADPRHLRKIHRPDRTAGAGRGLSRRHRQQGCVADRLADGEGHPRQDPGGDGPHRLGRRFLQQVPGQAGVRPAQAEWSVRDHAQGGGRLCRSFARDQVPWRRPGDGRPDARRRHQDRPRPEVLVAARPPAALWEVGRLVLRYRAR